VVTSGDAGTRPQPSSRSPTGQAAEAAKPFAAAQPCRWHSPGCCPRPQQPRCSGSGPQRSCSPGWRSRPKRKRKSSWRSDQPRRSTESSPQRTDQQWCCSKEPQPCCHSCWSSWTTRSESWLPRSGQPFRSCWSRCPSKEPRSWSWRWSSSSPLRSDQRSLRWKEQRKCCSRSDLRWSPEQPKCCSPTDPQWSPEPQPCCWLRSRSDRCWSCSKPKATGRIPRPSSRCRP
jgi:hypothetical protein